MVLVTGLLLKFEAVRAGIGVHLPDQTFIKGECVETASVSDREEFPNGIE